MLEEYRLPMDLAIDVMSRDQTNALVDLLATTSVFRSNPCRLDDSLLTSKMSHRHISRVIAGNKSRADGNWIAIAAAAYPSLGIGIKGKLVTFDVYGFVVGDTY